MQTVSESKQHHWALRDVLLLAFVAVFIGFIFWVLGPVYNILAAALTPMGLAPFANDLLIGGWMMAAPLASILIRQAGAGVLGELFASAVEMLLGGQWGVATLLSGLVQGVGSEAGFAALAYKDWHWRGIFPQQLLVQLSLLFGHYSVMAMLHIMLVCWWPYLLHGSFHCFSLAVY